MGRFLACCLYRCGVLAGGKSAGACPLEVCSPEVCPPEPDPPEPYPPEPYPPAVPLRAAACSPEVPLRGSLRMSPRLPPAVPFSAPPALPLSSGRPPTASPPSLPWPTLAGAILTSFWPPGVGSLSLPWSPLLGTLPASGDFAFAAGRVGSSRGGDGKIVSIETPALLPRANLSPSVLILSWKAGSETASTSTLSLRSGVGTDSLLVSLCKPMRPSFSMAMKLVRTLESGRGESEGVTVGDGD